jgi:hypothetical protein
VAAIFHMRRRKGSHLRDQLKLAQLSLDAVARGESAPERTTLCESEEERQLLRGLILKACGRL